MSIIPLQNWIPDDVRVTIKGMLLESYDEVDSLTLLDQDILEVTVGDDFRIDVGWFPENDPAGRFIIRVFDHNQVVTTATPIETRKPLIVAKLIGDLTRRYNVTFKQISAVASSGTA